MCDGLTIGAILADPDAWSVARGCAEEAVAVASAAGVRLDVGDPIEHVRRLGGKIGGAKPSMLLDFEAGRRCEIDAINGSIPASAARWACPPPSTTPSSGSSARASARCSPSPPLPAGFAEPTS